MIEWSDQKVDEKEVAIFFLAMQKIKKKKIQKMDFTDFTDCGLVIRDFADCGGFKPLY
jgi:hypothetical protein